MAIIQKFLSLDNYFTQTTGNKVILNNLSYWEKEDKKLVEQTMQSIYDKDTITMVPKCMCGETEGMYLLGKECRSCGTPVVSIFGDKDPLLWFKAIEGAGLFISPQFYTMLSKVISTKIDVLRWVGDSNYNPPMGNNDMIVDNIAAITGFQRSYVWLINNLEKVIVTLMNMPKYRVNKKNKIFEELLLLFKTNKNNILSTYLPLLNRRMFVMENTSMGRYTNIGVADAFDSVLYFIKMCNNDNQIYKERTMARTVSDMAKLYEEHVKTYLSAKEGILRKHMYGTRSHFTARCVIASLPGPHRHNEVWLPWGVGVTLFRPHIINLLDKKGFAYKKINSKLFRAVQHYDEDIAICLDELIKSSKYDKGIPLLVQRNPSLSQSSANAVYCSRFKKEVDDTTMNISIMLTKMFSGDYDGDELNITLLLDNFMHDKLKTFSPYYNVPDMYTVYGVSGNLTLSNPVVATISNHLANERNRLDNVK